MLKFDQQGLIPAILQDADTREVLMVAYMNEEAVRRTVESGDAWFWSRSRQELWHKGATSGNYQRVERIQVDCDGDAILVDVRPDGPACHTGAVSCFFQSVEDAMANGNAAPEESAMPDGHAGSDENATATPGAIGGAATATLSGTGVVEELAAVIAQRHRDQPEGSYVAGLLKAGIDRVAKKVGEEAAETIIAAKNGAHDEIVWEVADLWFHSLVLLEATGVPVQDVWAELERRRK
jgi:phosphoribosyl-ATP pyrophosphohydrolase/phosphoribosyl-AMP cyclohydrolase